VDNVTSASGSDPAQIGAGGHASLPVAGWAIGVDVGGTKIAAGIVDGEGRIVHRVRVATPDTVEGIDEGIAGAVMSLRAKLTSGSYLRADPGDGTPAQASLPGAVMSEVIPVGIAAAGFIDQTRSVVRFAPNIPWREHPLANRIRRLTQLPVVVENDANAAAWAEFRFGGGAGVNDMAMLTVGTGLGGGIVLGGALLRGASGMAGELGHVRAVPEGRPCGCGQRGCWEQYASGTALVKAARALAVEDPDSAKGLLAAAHGDPSAIQGQMITAAAIAGDDAAIGLLADLGHWLGEAIAGVASSLDPAVVVIGGGVAEAGDLLLAPARRAFASSLSGGANRPHLAIRAAELGNDAGIIGAADLARL
jgi:glucokinase